MKMLTKIRLQFILIASAAVMAILIVFVGIFNSFNSSKTTAKLPSY